MTSKYSISILLPIVNRSKSIANVLRLLKLKHTGNNYAHIKHRIKECSIDISHFSGSRWSKGLTSLDHPSIQRPNIIPDKRFFVVDIIRSSGVLLKRLLKAGVKYECSVCGISTWLKKKIRLHVDHINGIKNDNRLNNLRFICPNCHQQTDTWGGKNLKCRSGGMADTIARGAIGRKVVRVQLSPPTPAL